MLPHSKRLSVEQFNKVMEKGKITHSPLFIVRSCAADPNDKAMVSAVAPQKIFKKAVQRNKMRRQIYEAIKPVYTKLDPRIKTIVFAKPPAQSANFTVLEKGIEEIFVKAGIMK